MLKMDDSQLLQLMEHIDQALAAQQALNSNLSKGRMELAFSRLHKSLTGASIVYVPKQIQASVRVKIGKRPREDDHINPNIAYSATITTTTTTTTTSSSSSSTLPLELSIVRVPTTEELQKQKQTQPSTNISSIRRSANSSTTTDRDGTESSSTDTVGAGGGGGGSGTVTHTPTPNINNNNPLVWFGDNPAPAIASAQIAFIQALQSAVELRTAMNHVFADIESE